MPVLIPIKEYHTLKEISSNENLSYRQIQIRLKIQIRFIKEIPYICHKKFRRKTDVRKRQIRQLEIQDRYAPINRRG